MKIHRKSISALMGHPGFQMLLTQGVLWIPTIIRSNKNMMSIPLISATLILLWCTIKNRWVRGIALFLGLVSAYFPDRPLSFRLLDGKGGKVSKHHYRRINPLELARYDFRLWNFRERTLECGPWKETKVFMLGSGLERLKVRSNSTGVNIKKIDFPISGIYSNQLTKRVSTELALNPDLNGFTLEFDFSKTQYPEVIVGAQVHGSIHYDEAVYFLAKSEKCWIVSYGKRVGKKSV